MAVVARMSGTSPELYRCIAPLVMDPDIIKYNHGYPFKTGESFAWFVAFSGEPGRVAGFFPVEIRRKSVVINNYYVAADDEKVFHDLLDAVKGAFESEKKVLEAVVQKTHEPYFLAEGFEVRRAWNLYVKMIKT